MRRTRKCFANKPFSPCGWPIVCFIEIRDRAVNGYSQSCDVSKSQGRTDIYANGETFLSEIGIICRHCRYTAASLNSDNGTRKGR